MKTKLRKDADAPRPWMHASRMAPSLVGRLGFLFFLAGSLVASDPRVCACRAFPETIV